ncbi:MAG: hypothetical protein AAFW84_24360 [Cyanobacteria bacterium J06635_15]
MSKKMERLLEKQAQIKAQIQQARAIEKTLAKKQETRRKVLIGAAILARVEAGLWKQSDLLDMMDGFLTRPAERELFGLENGGVGSSQPLSNKKKVQKISKSMKGGGSKPLPE